MFKCLFGYASTSFNHCPIILVSFFSPLELDMSISFYTHSPTTGSAAPRYKSLHLISILLTPNLFSVVGWGVRPTARVDAKSFQWLNTSESFWGQTFGRELMSRLDGNKSINCYQISIRTPFFNGKQEHLRSQWRFCLQRKYMDYSVNCECPLLRIITLPSIASSVCCYYRCIFSHGGS